MSEATAGLEQAHGNKAIEAELLHAAEAITTSPEFMAVEREIKHAVDEAAKFGRALSELWDKGPMGYIEDMSRDEERDLQRQIDLLRDLGRDSRKRQENLEKAKRDLEQTKGRLSPAQEKARK